VGVCLRKKKTGGRGVAENPEGTPLPGDFGEGWGVMGWDFFGIAGPGSDVFEKSLAAEL